ncbi:MAG: hypothetical protein IKQ06_00220 [Bacilli bacterium]|nr:hypothetical protein [Bacilli bacterium]
MNDMSFDITRLNEVYDMLTKYHMEYTDLVSNLEMEINRLGLTWGTTNNSVYNEFKEKYLEKKSKLTNVDNIMNELLNNLEMKKREIEEATVSSENSFE